MFDDTIMRLARIIALRSPSHLDIDDRTQEAALALIGSRPSWARARGAIIDASRRMRWGSRNHPVKIHEFKDTRVDNPRDMLAEEEEASAILRCVPYRSRAIVAAKANGVTHDVAAKAACVGRKAYRADIEEAKRRIRDRLA